jgi:hypothetical protein
MTEYEVWSFTDEAGWWMHDRRTMTFGEATRLAWDSPYYIERVIDDPRNTIGLFPRLAATGYNPEEGLDTYPLP